MTTTTQRKCPLCNDATPAEGKRWCAPCVEWWRAEWLPTIADELERKLSVPTS